MDARRKQRIMAAAAIAQQEGRVPRSPSIRGAMRTSLNRLLIFLAMAGGDLTRTIISHIDRTIFDDERLFRLADTGVVIELDLFGMETSYYKLNENHRHAQ
jgi:phosphotriesterase-related protein